MATRIKTILDNVRYKIGDSAGSRVKPERLISLVDEAQKDIAKRAKILRAQIYLNLFPGQAIYKLPSEAITLERVLYRGKPVSLVTHAVMDKSQTDWESEQGPDVLAIVYDKLNSRTIRVYPAPLIADGDVPVSPLTGMVMSLSGFYMQNLLGVLTDLEISADEIKYSEVPLENCLKLNYSKYPATITSINDDLEVDPVYDAAIEYYVAGKAFRDDTDAQNRTTGAEELNFYDRELADIGKDSMLDTVNTEHRTEYIGAFDGNS